MQTRFSFDLFYFIFLSCSAEADGASATSPWRKNELLFFFVTQPLPPFFLFTSGGRNKKCLLKILRNCFVKFKSIKTNHENVIRPSELYGKFYFYFYVLL